MLPSERKLTWNKLGILTLLVMFLGPVAGSVLIDRVGFFAPPLLAYTVPVYLLLWAPIFIIGALLRPGGSKKAFLWLLPLSILLIVFGLILLGPALNYTSGVCQPDPLSDQPVRYTCVSAPNYQGARFSYVLEGQEGSPFVQLHVP